MGKASFERNRSAMNVIVQTKNNMFWERIPLGPAQKVVVIGNGPSLVEHISAGDFDLLVDLQAEGLVETWSMNLIDLIYPQTSWRPSFWVWVEFLAYDVKKGNHLEFTQGYARDAVETHLVPGVERCIIEERFRKYMEPWLRRHSDSLEVGPGVDWISRCEGLGHGVQVGSDKAPADWHLPVPCVYGGTMNTVLPLVFQAGRREVAVIGCDLGIVAPDPGQDYNHFDPKYMTYTHGDYSLQDDTLRDVHRMAKVRFEAEGGRVVNSGIGGVLDVYDRVPLREFLDV